LGYFLAFGVVAAGYTVLVWGHYIQQHQPVSMWYLLSGSGNKYAATKTEQRQMARGPAGSVGVGGIAENVQQNLANSQKTG
jgi:hypothetical protein